MISRAEAVFANFDVAAFFPDVRNRNGCCSQFQFHNIPRKGNNAGNRFLCEFSVGLCNDDNCPVATKDEGHAVPVNLVQNGRDDGSTDHVDVLIASSVDGVAGSDDVGGQDNPVLRNGDELIAYVVRLEILAAWQLGIEVFCGHVFVSV